MKHAWVVAVIGGAVFGLGCEGDPEPVDAGGTDSGTVVPRDSGLVLTGEGFERQRAAFSRVDAAFCACDFAEQGFATAAECAAFGDLEVEETCEDQAFAAAAESAWPAFDCLAPIIETYASCVEAASCGEAALSACVDAANNGATGCPDAPSSYTSPLTSCFDANVVGATASPCPENATASTELGDSVFSGTTVAAGDDHAGSCLGEGAGSPERVFQWTAPSAGTFDIDTAGSAFDTILYVLTACADGDELACNDDIDGELLNLRSTLSVTLTAGQTIVIVVDGYGGSAGTFQVNIAEAAPPADGGVPLLDGGPTSDGGPPTDGGTVLDGGTVIDAGV